MVYIETWGKHTAEFILEQLNVVCFKNFDIYRAFLMNAYTANCYKEKQLNIVHIYTGDTNNTQVDTTQFMMPL